MANNVRGVNFWRMKQFFNKMKEKGMLVAMYGYGDNNSKLAEWQFNFAKDRQIRDDIRNILNQSDVTVWGYLHSPIVFGYVMMLQDKYGKKMLAEIDDEIISTPIYNPAFKSGYKPGNLSERVVIEHLKISNGVITSTPFLKKVYKEFNRNITVIPNCIDFNAWNVKNKNNKKKLRIGWIGAGNHDEDLEIMQEIIPRIQAKYKNVEFYFVHGVPEFIKKMCGMFNMGNIKCSSKWADIEKYPDHVASFGFDIGMAPLQINKFNQSKSNLRWLEYSALGIPTVATKIEPYAKSIKNGETGYLCENVDDWIESLSALIENGYERKKMGKNAKQAIFENYELDKTTDRYIKFLKGVRNGQRGH